jgi:hypothetical protein
MTVELFVLHFLVVKGEGVVIDDPRACVCSRKECMRVEKLFAQGIVAMDNTYVLYCPKKKNLHPVSATRRQALFPQLNRTWWQVAETGCKRYHV